LIDVFGALITFCGAFCWALASIFYRKALSRATNPFIANIIRIPLAFLVLTTIALLDGKISEALIIITTVKTLLYLVLATFVMNIVGDTLYLLAIRNVGVAIGYPLAYMYPVFVAILATIILAEPLRMNLLLGTIIAVTGVWLLSSKKQEVAITTGYSFSIGVLAGIGAALAFSFGIILFRIMLIETDPIATAIIKLIILFVMTSPIFWLRQEEVKASIDKRTLLIGMIGGVFGIGIGDWFFYIGLARIGAGSAAAITTSSPMLSLFLAVILLKEKVGSWQVIGTVLIVIGILLTLI